MQDWKMRHQIAGVENAEPRKYGKPTNTPVVVVVVSDYQHGLCELKL